MALSLFQTSLIEHGGQQSDLWLAEPLHPFILKGGAVSTRLGAMQNA